MPPRDPASTGARRPQATDRSNRRRHSSSAIRRPFTDSEELLRARAHVPEDRRISAVLVSGVAACVAGLLAYLALCV
jgi:hypothetical protein